MVGIGPARRIGLPNGKSSFGCGSPPNVSASVPAIVCRLSARSLGLAADAAVGSWVDDTGNAKNATQATAGSKPKFKLSVVNGYPGVLFDGVDDFLEVAGLSAVVSGSAFSIVAVVLPVVVDYHRIWSGFNSGDPMPFVEMGNNPSHLFTDRESDGGTGFQECDGLSLEPAVATCSVVVDHGSMTLWRNGVKQATDATWTEAMTLDSFYLGAGGDGGTPYGFFSGYVFEVLVANGAFSDGDREWAERLVGTRYGL